MKTTTITIQYDETKMSTLKPYLEKKGVDLQTELTKAVDGLYNKLVPAQVREFFQMQSGEIKPKAQKPKVSKPKSENKENADGK